MRLEVANALAATTTWPTGNCLWLRQRPGIICGIRAASPAPPVMSCSWTWPTAFSMTRSSANDTTRRCWSPGVTPVTRWVNRSQRELVCGWANRCRCIYLVENLYFILLNIKGHRYLVLDNITRPLTFGYHKYVVQKINPKIVLYFVKNKNQCWSFALFLLYVSALGQSPDDCP